MTAEATEVLTLNILGYLITIFGMLGNSFSLFYFFSRSSTNSRQGEADTSTTHLFVSLNIFDIIVCVSKFISITAKLVSPSNDGENNTDALEVIDTISFLSQEMTYFVTCLLSCRRLLNLLHPLYLVKSLTLKIATVIFSLLLAALETCHWTLAETIEEEANPFDRARCVIRVLLILVIILSSVISFIKLKQSYTEDNHKRTRYATITVAILSGIFCVCNIGPLIGSGIYAFDYMKYESVEDKYFLDSIFYLILVPLNSACNPIVYITRRSQMRKFLGKQWMKVKGKCTSSCE